MNLDLSTLELENMRMTPAGLRTRRGYIELATPTAGTRFAAGHTLESPFTSEPWHYLFEQNTSTRELIMRAFTEEFFEVFNLNLGIVPARPVVTKAVANNQVMFNSPWFTAPLWGVLGAGIITAVKTPSAIDGAVTLDLPAGHITSFGDKMPIAQGNVLYFNDSRADADVRTYSPFNNLPLAGAIYDHLQGPDGALYAFTSAGAFALSADALSQGQSVPGFVSKIPGIETSRARNACAAAGQVAVLQRDHVLLLPSQTKIPVSRSAARRYLQEPTEVDDLRRFGELFETPHGFLVGLRGRRGLFLDVDLDTKSAMWTVVRDAAGAAVACDVVGTLKTRDNEAIVVTEDRAMFPFTRGPTESVSSGVITGAARGLVPVKTGDRPRVKSVAVRADNLGEAQTVVVDDSSKAGATPTRAGDVIVGTSTWSVTEKWSGRSFRARRHLFWSRGTRPTVEIGLGGADRALDGVDIELGGQGRGREDA